MRNRNVEIIFRLNRKEAESLEKGAPQDAPPRIIFP